MKGGSATPARAVAASALRAIMVVLAATAWPAVASACPYCALSRDGGSAYLVSAVGMLLLPLGFGAGFVLWLRRRMRDGSHRDPVAGGPHTTEESSRR